MMKRQNWEYDDVVTVIKAIRVGKGTDSKVYTTAKAAAERASYLRNENHFMRLRRRGGKNVPNNDAEFWARNERLYSKLLRLFERYLK